ncbi:MAG: class I SAM-dependent methyltransferase [Planctomycetaceae bacterium]|nr:class I SAM-dependent methyltransferase [Planctomycetaceae bacterium]
MAEYRWNQHETAAGYDAAAPLVHPRYVEVQDAVMAAVPANPALIVDAGGGSGRLLERCLERWPAVHAVLIDQSAPFLDLARRRLERFAGRVAFHQRQLQDDWRSVLTATPTAVVSTSAVHHLEPPEKRAFYSRCQSVLAPGGALINGDEVRDPDDSVYRKTLEWWAGRMQVMETDGSVSAPMADALAKWRHRNVERFGEPRVSGDDCHETAEVQLDYFRSIGLVNVRIGWESELWAVMIGEQPA